MVVPNEYQGREQSFLKHRILTEYLKSWAHKLGSISMATRASRPLRLWYVDCFAGPWQARDEALQDTSIAIGLDALREAAATWSRKGLHVRIGAIFVEEHPEAFSRLSQYIEARRCGDQRLADIQALPGTFADRIQDINDRLGDDPAFIFVDPTGWKGAAMKFIRPLLGRARRDVLVNVMFNHINRFKGDQRAFLRQQMMDFFGLDEERSLAGLDENELLSLYREQLKKVCCVAYAADLAVLHPTIERTWFRLVVGGAHIKVLEVFRDAERAIFDKEMVLVREDAKRRAREQRSAQIEMNLPVVELGRREMQQDELARALQAAKECLHRRGELRFDGLWPPILEAYHLTKRDLAHALWQMHRHGELLIMDQNGAPVAGRQRRTVHDEEYLRLCGGPLTR